MEINEITSAIIESACKVHTALGPGLLEHTYGVCLKHELIKKGHKALSEVGLPVVYDGLAIDVGYRFDLLVDDRVILNFNVTSLRDGINRIAN